MKQTRIQVINETPSEHEGAWQLRLQWCRYLFANGKMEYGYRFIWYRPDGTMQAARGQARIPSYERIKRFFEKANEEGWGHYNADNMV